MPTIVDIISSIRYRAAMITPSQIRAARALIGWKQSDLSTACGLSLTGLNNIERGTADPKTSTLTAIRAALESAGVIFIDPNGQDAGVRLRRYQIGDRVKLRPGSMLALSCSPSIEPDEIGVVTHVEPHPPHTGPTYRMSAAFTNERMIHGAFEFEFRRAPSRSPEVGQEPSWANQRRIWRLEPTKPTHLSWSSSTYIGLCRVLASAEGEARDLAACAFALARTASLGDDSPLPPWTLSDVVSCVEDPDQSDAEGLSRVLFPDPDEQ